MKEKLFDLRQAAQDEVRKAAAEILPETVEVVRCRDCTRWHKYNGEQFGECKWTFRVTKAEGYCDDAERKDGGNE